MLQPWLPLMNNGLVVWWQWLSEIIVIWRTKAPSLAEAD